MPPAPTPLASLPAAGPGAGQAGLWYALAAVTVWGLFPIYIKGMSEANPLEILCHRIIWSMPVFCVEETANTYQRGCRNHR